MDVGSSDLNDLKLVGIAIWSFFRYFYCYWFCYIPTYSRKLIIIIFHAWNKFLYWNRLNCFSSYRVSPHETNQSKWLPSHWFFLFLMFFLYNSSQKLLRRNQLVFHKILPLSYRLFWLLLHRLLWVLPCPLCPYGSHSATRFWFCINSWHFTRKSSSMFSQHFTDYKCREEIKFFFMKSGFQPVCFFAVAPQLIMAPSSPSKVAPLHHQVSILFHYRWQRQ